ncbi:MAG TPA: hypothetical protein VFP37_18750 [Steroidobacteraceae bacterium]|nr:hypothetical protein [Steroidobacteraceae bacterium]
MKAKSTKELHPAINELLVAVFTLCLLDESLSEPALDQLVVGARRAAKKKVLSLPTTARRSSIDFDVLGHVVYRWQRSPKYLDEHGVPLSIPARGPLPSIEALFREIHRSDYFESGLRHLRQLGRVQRTKSGLYRPYHEVTIVQRLRPEFLTLLVQTINRVVATVLYNTSLKERNSVRMVERVTSVPDLPEDQISAFKLFAREQGGALIDTMNDWLERHRGEAKARRVTEGHVTAGLHVFAFVEENRTS